ncbi:MAG: carbohydrate kinase [Pseudothermotoga sp.]|uniref:PfkB family carbohydrate kinase n=1 Tax=Pseudothermotoga sp. TaxID=2033661 RepID=UPI000A6ACBE0|nr:carbohydrate kinase [Pseudothermotoga sp.]HBT39143.1 carbohydrate kinase [Pseudothermotoga sp.]HCO97524.1 carbohydrate kinase [Pseudothermotoga sp.]
MVKLTFIGHVSKDINKTQNETIVVPGGGVFYGSIAAQRLNVLSAVVTKISPKDTSLFKPIKEAGVQLLVLPSPETTTIENVYPSSNPDERKSRILHRADPFDLDDLERVKTKFVVVSALWHGEFPEKLLEHLRTQVEVMVVDAQGFLRNVLEDGTMSYSDWQFKHVYLPIIDVFKVDSNEAFIMTGERLLEKACKRISNYGPKIVLATHKDGVIAYDGKNFYEAHFSEYKMLGRTGRGDTCLAAFLAAIIDGKNLKQAVELAARVTSAKMQYAGPYRGGEVS